MLLPQVLEFQQETHFSFTLRQVAHGYRQGRNNHDYRPNKPRLDVNARSHTPFTSSLVKYTPSNCTHSLKSYHSLQGPKDNGRFRVSITYILVDDPRAECFGFPFAPCCHLNIPEKFPLDAVAGSFSSTNSLLMLGQQKGPVNRRSSSP